MMARTSIEACPPIDEFLPNDGVSVSSELGLQPTVAITKQAIDKWLAVSQIRRIQSSAPGIAKDRREENAVISHAARDCQGLKT